MSEERDPAVVVAQSESQPQPVNRARGATMAVLVGPQMANPRYVTRRFILESGGRIPEHRHDAIEHHQVVVRGEMALAIDGAERTVRAGDAVLIPAACAHSYENRSAEPCEFICVVPATSDYQTEWLEEPPAGAHTD